MKEEISEWCPNCVMASRLYVINAYCNSRL